MEAEVRKQDGTVISEKRDVTIVDTANPFGNLAEIDIEDDAGNLYDEFGFGTRVEVFVRDLITDFELGENETRPDFSQRFAGFVVERDDQNENSGRDNLQLTVYSFDQLLRADSVSNDQTGKTITEALEDIITEDTAVTWNAANVDVVDEQELTESLQGEKVEDALLKLSKKSVDEDFGVNDDIEFFFREQEPVSAPNDITDSDWIDYQLPERGEENKNESRTYFNSDGGEDSDRVAVVDDGVNQLELQESLGTEDPVIIADDRDRNDLSDVDDAAEDSEQNLDDKEVSRVYEFVAEAEDFLEAEPGQVFDVEIQTAGIDGEFRIAELEYRDVGSTVRITAIRNKGNTDDVLRRVTERLRRTELRSADFDGPEDRINIANVGVNIDNRAAIGGIPFFSTRITNALRNQIRDGWGGRGNVNVSEIAVGTDPSNLSRTNESLENEVERVSASETLVNSDTVEYSGSVVSNEIQEIGLFDGSDNLLYRAVTETPQDSGMVEIDFVVRNDPTVPKAVLTDLGQESIRDIIADNSPNLPVNYGFGSDQTEPSTSDTSLGNSVFVSDLTETLIQDASTQQELEDLVGDIAADKPLEIVDGKLQPLQTSIWRESVDEDDADLVTGDDDPFENNFGVDDGASEQNHAIIRNEGTTIWFDIRFEYQIPASDIDFRARSAVDGAEPDYFYTFVLEDTTNNQEYVCNSTFSGDVADPGNYRFDIFTSADFDELPDLSPNENYRLGVRVDTNQADANDDVKIDGVSIGDGRQNVTLPASLTAGTDYLDGPEDYPEQVTQTFAEVAQTRRELDFAKAELTIDDTSNGQFVELSNDGGSNFIRTNNSDTATASFASPSREVTSRIGLSRHGNRSNETPLTGFEPQQLDAWNLFANPLAVLPDGIGTALTIGLIPRNEIVGQTIRELGQLDSNENTLTRSIRAALEVQSEMRVFGRERLQIDEGDTLIEPITESGQSTLTIESDAIENIKLSGASKLNIESEANETLTFTGTAEIAIKSDAIEVPIEDRELALAMATSQVDRAAIVAKTGTKISNASAYVSSTEDTD